MTKAHWSPVSLTEVPVIQAFSRFTTWLPTGCLLTTIEQEAQRRRRRKAARIFMTIEDTL
jgi:hypothetical protein